jgi:hypothetical protein
VLDIGAMRGTFTGKITNRIYVPKIHATAEPTAVTVNGVAVTKKASYAALRTAADNGYFFDAAAKLLYVQIPGTTDKDYQLRVNGLAVAWTPAIVADVPVKRSMPTTGKATQWRLLNQGGKPYIDIEVAGTMSAAVTVYTTNGAAVARLNTGELSSGRHSLPVAVSSGRSLATGNYLVRMDINGLTLGKKVAWVN